jgi:glycosyltransferase involved in cell wall biosynthesis
MPRLTVVLPVYNHVRYVEETLLSLFAQDFTDFRITAIDDGSTDGSLEILDRYRNDIDIIKSPHQGPAAARNHALRVAQSEYIAFMDADDLCDRERLRQSVEKLESEDLGLVATALSFIDSSGKALPGLWQCPAHAAGNYWAALLERNWIGTPSVLFRRSVLHSSGFFDERFTHSEDYDLWLRIGCAHSIGYIDRPLVHCRRHPGNTSMNIESHQRFERMALRKVDASEARRAFESLHADPERLDEAWIWFLLRSAHPTLEAQLSAALVKYPRSHSLRFAFGVSQFDRGDWLEARDTFGGLDPADVASNHNLGVLLALCGDRPAAESHLHAALESRPDYHDAQANLGALQSGTALRLTRRPFRSDLIPMICSGSGVCA